METTVLRELRRDRQLTIMGLARLAGTTPAWLTYIELYGHTPGSELRQRIADALSVDEEDLWPGELVQSDEPVLPSTQRVIDVGQGLSQRREENDPTSDSEVVDVR